LLPPGHSNGQPECYRAYWFSYRQVIQETAVGLLLTGKNRVRRRPGAVTASLGDAMFEGVSDQIGRAVAMQLPQQPGAIRTDGLRVDFENRRDFLDSLAVGKEIQDLRLPPRGLRFASAASDDLCFRSRAGRWRSGAPRRHNGLPYRRDNFRYAKVREVLGLRNPQGVTGKELIARAIHDRSRRKDQVFVKVDCSAIPGTLLESELFGHERGAFTGAITQKLGRLEIADKGTLFLDEVGDLPSELQPKLLRVLQDRAFERLGSNRTHHLDVRVIAATNRDLEDMVSKGEFRADLYYRLKVFPVTIPPLRERPDDIPPLVWHYVHKYAQRLKKTIDTISGGAMEAFRLYPWPGNVRELQHFIERSVVLTSSSVLQAPVAALEHDRRKRSTSETPGTNRTMEEIERQSILEALRESNWVVGGPMGAARRLGLKRTTLASRMERLGISRVSLANRSNRLSDKRQR
jgi:hypothetical protein